MSNYEPTREQEKAIREYLHESIVPLIEQVLVKKLGQAMSYAAQELVNPKREWVGLTDEEMYQLANQVGFDAELMQRNHDKGNPSVSEHFAKAIEAKLKEKNFT